MHLLAPSARPKWIDVQSWLLIAGLFLWATLMLLGVGWLTGLLAFVYEGL